ncbi:phage integrase SAM-like domain-containing protein, partial [Acinetobacter baumannii]
MRQIIEYVTQDDEDICFSDYARLYIDRMVDRGQLRNAKNYKLALQHMERYYGTTKIMFGQLTEHDLRRSV